MIEVTSLGVRYGQAVAFDDVSLSVAPGQIVALLGNNGAGKTTLLRVLSGILRAQGGRVVSGAATLDGVDLAGARPESIVRRGLVQVPEGRRVFAQLSVEENLAAGGLSVTSRARVAAARERVLDMFPILAARGDQAAGLLSGGEQQMLAIGRALMSEPQMLVLDEPSLGVAPLVARQIMETVQQINAEGTSVLLVEQNTTLALSVAHHAHLLHGGRIVLHGPAAEVAASDMVREITLGHGAAGTAGAPATGGAR